MFVIHRLGAQPIDDALPVVRFTGTTHLTDPQPATCFGEILVKVAKEVGEDKIYLSFAGLQELSEEAAVALGMPAVDIFLMLDCTGVANDAINRVLDKAAAKLLTLWEAQQVVTDVQTAKA